MKRRFVSVLMALVMALSLLPAQVLAQELSQLGQNSAYTTGQDAVPLTYGNGQDTALHAIALQTIGNGQSVEVSSEGGLTSDLSAGYSVIKLTNNIDLNNPLTISYPVTIDLNGHVLEMADDANGSVFVIENGGHLTIKDSNPTTQYKFRVESNGLWVLDEQNGTETVSGGIITGGTGTSTLYYTNGGGVLIEAGGRLTMTGGSIVGCQATNMSGGGGGVKVESGGGFTMAAGAAIIGCVANSGGGVMTDNDNDTIYGEFIMNGGTIANCKTTDGRGGGVYASGPFTMNGGVIKNCEVSGLGEGGGLFLGGRKSTHTLNGTIISGNTADTQHIFVSQGDVTIGPNADITANIDLNGNTIEMDANATFTGTATVSGGSMYTPVANATEFTTALKNSGVSTIRLTDNIALAANSAHDIPPITRTLTLDLNDKVLKLKDNGFKIESTGHLTLTDTAETKTPKYFVRDTDTGLWTLTDSNTAYSVTGGVITGGKGYRDGNNVYGGGVYIESGGQLTLESGHIVGCTARGANAYGGGVFVSKNATFTMSGGSITGCTAVATSGGYAFGGGIRSEGSTTLSGTAVIRDCHAKGAGSSSYILAGGGISDAGTLNISGNVQIIGCTADGDSDAMYINKNNDSRVTGGTFYGSIKNTNKISGLIVTYQVNGKDYATQVVPSGSPATLLDPTKLDPTKQDYALDGWYKADGTKLDAAASVTESLTLTGWLYAPVTTVDELTAALANPTTDVIRLTDNITLPDGSTGISITPGRNVTLDLNGHVLDLGGKYILVEGADSYNYARLTIMDSDPAAEHKFKDDGTGLWVLDTNGDKTVKGGVITGGSNTSGGAMVVDWWGTVTMNGGNIVGCSASQSGGAVCSTSNFSFTMTGGSIVGCTAVNGSAIHLKGSKMNANGGTVNGTVLIDVEETIGGTNTGTIGSSGETSATQFNGDVTNNGEIGHGTFNGTVENTGTLIGGTYNGLIRNGNSNAEFRNVNSPLGIVENKPGTGSSTYHTVTFAPVDSTMEHTTRYFLDGGNISDQIKPAARTGYTFAGWYNGETKWDHTTDTVTGDLTLTAHWNKCDHKTSTKQPTCTTPATCSVCGGEIKALGHDWGAWMPNNNSTHTRTCTRDNVTDTKPCTDTNNDHKCDDCKQTLTSCADTNKDHLCDLCGKVLTVHTGGTATCIAKAVCDYCGQSYGDIDPANHADLKHVPARLGTAQAEGNIEYWYCTGCGKYYQDAAAKTQITQADTVTPRRIPQHYSGPTIMVVGTSYYDGGNTGLTFISSAAYTGFKGVQVDGETLAAGNYTSRENSGSQVCLKPAYLRGLTNGDHTVTILSAEGDVSAVFTVSVTGVAGSTDSPTTFDPGVTACAAAALVSLTGLTILPRKRRKDD